MFKCLKNYWESPVITRRNLERLTGGVINSYTIARLDIEGKGIKNSVMQGNKVAYNLDDVIVWLEENTVLDKCIK